MNDPEQWRPVVGYEGTYQVSSLGRVRRCDGNINPKRRSPEGILVPQPIDHAPQYSTVQLSRHCMVKRRPVHRIVCEAWHGPCPDGMEAAHKDGNAGNNTPENLTWKTQLENARDRGRHGTQLCGEKINLAKLTRDQVLEIDRLRDAGWQFKDIGAKLGVGHAHVSHIYRRIIWKHVPKAAA